MAKNLKLKAARAAMDLTQEELAVKVNVTRQTINAIEKCGYNQASICALRYAGSFRKH